MVQNINHQRAVNAGALRLEDLRTGSGKRRATGWARGAGVVAGAAVSAADNKHTALRRTRTQAAAGTACRRPPGGLTRVSHDRIHGRPPNFRRPRAPPTTIPSTGTERSLSAGTRQKFRGERARSGKGRSVVGSGKLNGRVKRNTTRRARESMKVAACTEHKSPVRRVAMD
ncbi:unnamed protein product [Colias eurytheme]|nr:unnamed protein product [Colias eurytheme]